MLDTAMNSKLMKNNLASLNKKIVYILRHAHSEYYLEMDNEGWASIQELLIILKQEKTEWQNLAISDLIEAINNSTKQRIEIASDRIRALYGHSINKKLKKYKAEPPEILYHGTTLEVSALVCKEGLKPMNRQFVHLSTDENTAKEVGYRKSSTPVIIIIQAKNAYQEGVNFYIGNNHIWLADFIPSKYLKF